MSDHDESLEVGLAAGMDAPTAMVISARDGRPVNAVRGFLDMSAMLVERRRPTRYVACLDLDWRPEFRVALVPSYKAHRVAANGSEQIPQLLVPQVPLLLDVLYALGLATSGADGFEADDLLGSLSKQAAKEDIDTVIVTGDADAMQLAGRAERAEQAGVLLVAGDDLIAR